MYGYKLAGINVTPAPRYACRAEKQPLVTGVNPSRSYVSRRSILLISAAIARDIAIARAEPWRSENTLKRVVEAPRPRENQRTSLVPICLEYREALLDGDQSHASSLNDKRRRLRADFLPLSRSNRDLGFQISFHPADVSTVARKALNAR